MCQLFPAFAHCKYSSRKCLAFFGITENHMRKTEQVLNLLRTKNFLLNYTRPLADDNADIGRYYQLIYEIEFPEDVEQIKSKLNATGYDTPEQSASH